MVATPTSTFGIDRNHDRMPSLIPHKHLQICSSDITSHPSTPTASNSQDGEWKFSACTASDRRQHFADSRSRRRRRLEGGSDEASEADMAPANHPHRRRTPRISLQAMIENLWMLQTHEKHCAIAGRGPSRLTTQRDR